MEEDVARLGYRNSKIVALNREGWRKLLKEAEAHPGLERERENNIRRTEKKYEPPHYVSFFITLSNNYLQNFKYFFKI